MHSPAIVVGLGLGLGLGLLVALLIGWARATARRRAGSRKARTRAARAQAGEVAAEDLLARAGYRVIARQAAHTWRFACDGEAVEAELRCDLLVERDAADDGLARTFVAEVKTGQLAPRLETAATRRQLLEYQIAYGADGVLLVDAEAETVRRVDFPLPSSPATPAPARPIVAMLIATAALGALLGHALW